MSIILTVMAVPSGLTIADVDLMDRSPEKPTFRKAPTRSAVRECGLLSLNSYGLKGRFNGPIYIQHMDLHLGTCNHATKDSIRGLLV
jgi:hypothetical protein